MLWCLELQYKIPIYHCKETGRKQRTVASIEAGGITTIDFEEMR
jgi:hypothetical protein